MKGRFLILALVVGLSATAQRGQTSSGSDIRALHLAASVEREIASGETHRYEMQMVAGQYVRVAFDPRGSVLSIKLIAPNGARILEVLALNAGQDPARVSWIAQTNGQYLIELSPAKS